MHNGHLQEQLDTQEDSAEVGQDTHLLILGSRWEGHAAVEALRPQDGLVVWAYDRSQQISDVLCSAGRAYVSTCVGHRDDPKQPARIAALRVQNGTELWRIESASIERQLVPLRLKYGLQSYFDSFSLGVVRDVVEGLRLRGGLELTDTGDTLLACNQGVAAFAFDPREGKLCWTLPIRSGRRPYVLAAYPGRFYVTGEHAGIQARDARTGGVLWSSARPKYVQQVVAAAAAIYVWHERKDRVDITVLRATDGSVQRRLFLSQRQEDQERLLTVTADGIAYCQRNHCLVAIRLQDEQELWCSQRLDAGAKTDDREPFWVKLARSSRLLAYAFTQRENNVHTVHVGTLDRASGRTVWEWHRPQRPGFSLLATGDMVYVSTDGGMYALQGSSGRLLWNMPVGGRMVAASVPSGGVGRHSRPTGG